MKGYLIRRCRIISSISWNLREGAAASWEGTLSAQSMDTVGNARKIDNLMTDALTIGAQQDKHTINAEIILAAANNQSLT